MAGSFTSQMPLYLGSSTSEPAEYKGTADPPVDGQAAALASTYRKTDTGQIYIKTGATDTDWTLISTGSSGTVINDLWGPRASPHAQDDEFTGPTLDAGWDQTGFAGALDFGTRPDFYANPVVNAASFESRVNPDQTDASWLRIQPGASQCGIWKPLDFGSGVPTNLLVWCRMIFGWRNQFGVANGDMNAGLSLFAQSGGAYSESQTVQINMNNTSEATANQVKAIFWDRDSGGTHHNLSYGDRMNLATSNRVAYSFWSGYFGIQKIGDLYYGWILDDGGRLYMGESSPGAGIDGVGLWCQSANSSNPGIMVCDFDFIRFYEGADWLP